MDKLFPFQEEGISFLSKYEKAWLLDDMGLGKTVQLIRTVEATINGGGLVLVVCPNSLKYNWVNELQKWSTVPYLSKVLEGTIEDRYYDVLAIQTLSKLKDKIYYLITNYEMYSYLQPLSTKKEEKLKVPRDPIYIDMLKDMIYPWDYVLLDEVHRIKGRKSDSTKALYKIVNKAKRVYFSTGTPVLNNISELYPLLHITDKENFHSYWNFATKYCNVEVTRWGMKVSDVENKDDVRLLELKSIIEGFSIRRLKEDVLPDLPEKTIYQIPIILNEVQQKQYDTMYKDFILQLENGTFVDAKAVIAQLIRLKQVAVTTDQLDKESTKLTGAKIDALEDIIESTNKQIVIVSQFEQVISKLYNIYSKNYTCGLISGRVLPAERQITVDRFQDGKIQLLFCSLMAAYQGFNFTSADTIVFLDKAWTPAYNLQMQDRLLRIGQKNAVSVMELLAKNTVEETHVEETLLRKFKTFSNIFNNTELQVECKELAQILKGLK